MTNIWTEHLCKFVNKDYLHISVFLTYLTFSRNISEQIQKINLSFEMLTTPWSLLFPLNNSLKFWNLDIEKDSSFSAQENGDFS